MPSDTHGGGRRIGIYNWRVKAGNKEVFSAPKKIDCEEFMRKNSKVDGKKTRLIPPNL